MPPETLLLIYVVSLLAALSIIALYSERRRKRFEQRLSDDRIFRCIKCGCVYTDDPDGDRSRCSQCGTVNDAFQF